MAVRAYSYDEKRCWDRWPEFYHRRETNESRSGYYHAEPWLIKACVNYDILEDSDNRWNYYMLHRSSAGQVSKRLADYVNPIRCSIECIHQTISCRSRCAMQVCRIAAADKIKECWLSYKARACKVPPHIYLSTRNYRINKWTFRERGKSVFKGKKYGYDREWSPNYINAGEYDNDDKKVGWWWFTACEINYGVSYYKHDVQHGLEYAFAGDDVYVTLWKNGKCEHRENMSGDYASALYNATEDFTCDDWDDFEMPLNAHDVAKINEWRPHNDKERPKSLRDATKTILMLAKCAHGGCI